MDIVEYLTMGQTRSTGHPRVRVSADVSHACHTLEFHPVEYYDMSVSDAHHVHESQLQQSRALLFQLHRSSLSLHPFRSPCSPGFNASLRRS